MILTLLPADEPRECVLYHRNVSASMLRRTLIVRKNMRQALHNVHTKPKRLMSMQINRMHPGYSCYFITHSCLSAHLAALALEPTNLLIPTLFAFLPFSCACIGCSFSHLSSSLYASTAASKSQSACCMYNVATSYLSAGGTLVSLSVL